MVIVGYSMNGYYGLFYEWLLWVILLMVIVGYFINRYCGLFYE
jgi:hypothetical protein